MMVWIKVGGSGAQSWKVRGIFLRGLKKTY